MTTVSGIIRDTQGNPLAGVNVSVRYKRPLVGFDGGAAAQNVRLFTADGSGEVVMADLVPGQYDIQISVPPTNASGTPVQILSSTMSVDDTATQTLESALDDNIVVTPNVLAQAIAAANAAEGFAGDAEASATQAATSASNAATSASQAGTSASSALSNSIAAGAPIFPTIAAGISGVAVGDVFLVPITPSGGLDVRQKTGASTSTSIGQILPPTQSATDTTSGRLTKVGDFGLGALSIPPYPLNDFDANPLNVPTGFYRVTSGVANNPFGFGFLEIIKTSTDITFLRFFRDLNSGIMAVRGFRGSSFSTPWFNIYHTGNILGTVSQSSGVPTGAIIERGSNANGEFVRFADGTQICHTVAQTIDVNIQIGSVFRGLGGLQNWPAAFIEKPAVIQYVDDTNRVELWGGPSAAITNTQWRLRLFSANVQTEIPGRVVGIGRWF